MYLLSQLNGLDLYFSRQYLKAAVLVSLLTVWVLVGLFYYLNRYTRRRYFTIWTAAWLFYALWITLSFGVRGDHPKAWEMMLEQWCVGVSAVFLFWGSQRFLGERVRQRLIGWFFVFLLVWSYVSNTFISDPLWEEVPLFSLIAAASLLTARSFFRYRRKRGYIGATLLTLGFLLWGCYMAGYPFLENSKDLVSVALFISAVIQLLVAVSMIVLVLEEVRHTHQLAVEQIHVHKQERDVLQTKFASTEERYRTLFDQAGEAIVITDTEALRILELNRAAGRLLGVTREEAARHSLGTFCQMKTAGAPRRRTGDEWFRSICQRPLSLIRKSGGRVQVEIEGAKVDFDGRAAFQFFVRELTERAQLEQQLRQAEKLSALGQMISGVAHELNNPLAVVKGYLDLILAHHDLPLQTRTDLEKVARESNRAAKLVRNFLSFAREQPAHREPVNFNKLIQSVAELRQFDFTVAGVELQIEADPDLPPTFADPDQIQQVFMNLINNAVQAMADMPGRARLKIRTQHKNGLIQIHVEDNGPGVPPDLVTKIFEPFFTTKEVGTGTGLGLSMAHSIMTEHGGRIFYQPSPLGGAGFVLEFPVVTASAPATSTEEPLLQPATTETSEQAPSRILVLDDERSIAEMLGEMLDILGHAPVICCSAAQALELIEEQTFDLIISDFRMPGLNGRQFYELATRKHPALARRIIFLTGDVVNEETLAFLRSTGNPHLGKPFNLAKVQQVIAEVLNANEATAAAAHH